MRSRCVHCNLREVCLPRAIADQDDAWLEGLVYARRRVAAGMALFSAGQPFGALYAVHGGFFKTKALDGAGREQVTGFFMAGELLGLDGIATTAYDVTAVALEDSVVCVLPYPLIEERSRELPRLQRAVFGALSREIVREHNVMMLLGSMSAEARLAAFLVNLARRLRRRGYSPSDFRLRMTREDIGSYLGLTLETVSRLFSRFNARGILEIRQRHVRLIDPARLEALAEAA